MSKFKFCLITMVLTIFTIVGIISKTYAISAKVTDENLKTSLQKFVSSIDNDKNYKIIIENNQIKITSDEGIYTLKYDLTNKPIFIYEANIEQGMSYKDFQEKTNGISSTIIGYIAVADIQGIKYEDSLLYFSMYLLMSAFSDDTENQFVIVDDTDLSEGVTIVKDPNDTKTIYASEFGDHVMEYVNSLYAEKQTFKDTEGLNTFVMTTERKNITDTSCKIVTTLTIDTDADFSKMIEYSNKVSDSISTMYKDITEENADYVIKLKVGQKCKIESNESITGYELAGSNYIEFDKDNTTITATGIGEANGYIYFDNNNIRKSIYVISEENVENKTLEPISIKINTTSSTNNTDEPITTETTKKNTQTTTQEKTTQEKTTQEKTAQEKTAQEKTTQEKNTQEKTAQDTTVRKGILPQTGNNTALLVSIISLLVILCIKFGVKVKKYNDIK